MKHRGLSAASLLILAGVTGCSGDQKPAPLAPSCTFAVTLGSSEFGGGGGTTAATVKAPAGCSWAAASQADWITIGAGATGSGDGSVAFSVSAFDGGATRSGGVVIAKQTFTVTQRACDVRVEPAQVTLGDNGGQAEIAIDVDEGCRWTAEAGASWVTIDPATGVGAARATVRVDKNREGEREAVVHVNARVVTIRQSAEACRFDVSLAPAVFPVDGGQGVLRVGTRPGCSWRAETDGAAWLMLSGPSNGNGAGEIPVVVSANSEAADRRAILRVGNANAEVLQAGRRRCEFRVQPVEALVHSRGGSGSVTVSTDPACSWTAANTQTFVRLRGEGTHRGSDTITYDVEANPEGYVTGFRKAAIAIRWDTPTSGQNVWLWQFGDCHTLFMAPMAGGARLSEVTFDAVGGSQNIWVLTDSAFTCPWRIEGTNDWLGATGAGVGSTRDDPPLIYRGDGHVTITVTANPSSQPRSATLQIGERPLRVIQAGR